MIDVIIINRMIEEAFLARENAYAPYSSFAVGAAVYAENGIIYSGCNIENSSYGATNCAERTAIYKAISEGNRKIHAVAVVAGMKSEKPVYTSPCGICRQVISEFGDEDTPVIMAVSKEDYRIMTLKELLPDTFKLDK